MAWTYMIFGVKLSCSPNLSHQEVHAMNSISQTNPVENHLSDALNYFFRTFHILVSHKFSDESSVLEI